jgi:DNA end-binding protein Ku
MARPIWKGTISFGMVSIPVKLYSATESKDISFRQLHESDNARIQYQRWCPVEEQKVEIDEIVKGYEYTKDRYVIVSDEDFEALPVAGKRTIELSAFVDAADIDPIYYEKTYYLEPEEIGAKPYALLVRALEEKGKTAIGKIAIRSRERLCALRLMNGQLAMETLLYADEVRPQEALDEIEISEAEMKIATSLVELLEEDFDIAKYRDDYRDALMKLIEAKLEGQEFVAPEEPAEAAPTVDLMAALRASVEAARARKEGKADASEDEEEKAPSRRRKAAAKAS